MRSVNHRGVPGPQEAAGGAGEGWGSVQPGLGALVLLYDWPLHWVWGNGDRQSQLPRQSSVENLGVNTFGAEIHEAPVWGRRHGPRSHDKIVSEKMPYGGR